IDAARDIVSFRHFDVRTLGERLLIRALPNQRLIAAFGINNAFTTTEPWVHKRFVRYAVGLITRVNVHNEEWRNLSLLGQDTLRHHLSVESGHKLRDQQQRLHLTSTVRILCFVVVLNFLFPGVENIDLQAARSATKGINQLWVQSKDASRPVSKREQDRLVTKIRQMLPINGQLYDLSGLGEQSNPLNIILPAFETLWRVVLLTYVHIAFRGISSDGPRVTTESLARGILADLPKHWEALRLYPPTKRIHRATSPSIRTRIHHAPKYLLQISSPSTATSSSGVTTPTTSSSPFGERMIAMLLGVLFQGLGTSGTGTTIEYGDAGLDGDLHAPLPTGREDAEGWHVFL
ncbi:hypothetical protein PG994_012908, partial [Apiospora phragmitis]